MRGSPLKKSIERLIESKEEEHYKELKEKIASISRNQTNLSKSLDDLKRISERLSRLEAGYVGVAEKSELQHLQNEFSRERERLKEEVRKDIMAHKEAVAKTALETSELKDQISQLSAARDELKKMNAKDILAQIAGIEQKAKWLEAQLEHANIAELKSRLSAIESELSKLKVSTPLVIE